MLVCWWMIVIRRLWEAVCARTFRSILFTFYGVRVCVCCSSTLSHCKHFSHFVNASATAEPYIMVCAAWLRRFGEFWKTRFCRNRAACVPASGHYPYPFRVWIQFSTGNEFRIQPSSNSRRLQRTERYSDQIQLVRAAQWTGHTATAKCKIENKNSGRSQPFVSCCEFKVTHSWDPATVAAEMPRTHLIHFEFVFDFAINGKFLAHPWIEKQKLSSVSVTMSILWIPAKGAQQWMLFAVRWRARFKVIKSFEFWFNAVRHEPRALVGIHRKLFRCYNLASELSVLVQC